jgi:hypothetical protein
MAEQTDGSPCGGSLVSVSSPSPEDLNQRLGVRMCGIASVVTYTWLPSALLIYQN